MNPSASPAQFTVADFNRMGSQSGFRYRLPQLTGALRADPETLCIAEGRVDTYAIRPGLTLVLSDVRVHQHYEATSMLSLIHIYPLLMRWTDGQARSSCPVPPD